MFPCAQNATAADDGIQNVPRHQINNQVVDFSNLLVIRRYYWLSDKLVTPFKMRERLVRVVDSRSRRTGSRGIALSGENWQGEILTPITVPAFRSVS